MLIARAAVDCTNAPCQQLWCRLLLNGAFRRSGKKARCMMKPTQWPARRTQSKHAGFQKRAFASRSSPNQPGKETKMLADPDK